MLETQVRFRRGMRTHEGGASSDELQPLVLSPPYWLLGLRQREQPQALGSLLLDLGVGEGCSVDKGQQAGKDETDGELHD